MATVIDSLVVKLGLDSKDFQKGSKGASAEFKRTKDNAARTAKDIEKSGKQAAEFFNQARKAAVQFFSVLTVGRGLVDFTGNVIRTGAQLDRMSTRIGESAANLSRWQGAVRQSGGSAEGFLATVQNISQQFTQLKETGDAPIRQLLTQLGVSAADASGKAKPVLQLLRDIGDELDNKQWSNADKYNKLLSAGFDEGTINLLMKGRVEREKLLASQKAYSEADAKAAREAQENWEKTKLEIERTTQALIIKLLPTLEKLAASMVSFAEVAVPVLSTVVGAFTSINDATNGWLISLGLVLVSLKAITGIGLGSIAAGVAKLAGGAAGLVSGAGVAGVAGVGAAGALGYGAGSMLYDKAIAGTSTGDFIGRNIAKGLAFFGNKNAQESLDAESRASMGSRSASGKIGGGAPSYDLANKLAAADKANGLPPGTMASIMKQESGGNKKFLDDPSAYHYGLDANGRRIAPHTGKVSTAFGPFGILESTGKDPGYGVDPLKDKSLDEQIRFASQYAAARIKKSGSVAGGLAGYGDGAKYASQVMGRIPGQPMTGVGAGAGRGGGYGSQIISIAEVNVVTQATDATGIARDMHSAIVRQADGGMR